MKPQPHNVIVKFLGEWAILRCCKSKREAIQTLKYEQSRSSWPMKVEKA